MFPLVPVDDDEEEEGVDLQQQSLHDTDGSIFVYTLSHDDFRRRLVVHFDICWRKKQVVWPTRN